MHRQPHHWHPEDAYAFATEEGERDSEARNATVPGPLLVLTKDEPVEITLRNELPGATSIHWHGIEFESAFDGVPGWSGTSLHTNPAISPGQSFSVRFTPPRAGTFMYHTHAHDNRQLASELYGTIVVLEPGETFDPARDHVVLIGMEGPKDAQKYERFRVVVNGGRNAAVATAAAGQQPKRGQVNVVPIGITTAEDRPRRYRTAQLGGGLEVLNAPRGLHLNPSEEFSRSFPAGWATRGAPKPRL